MTWDIETARARVGLPVDDTSKDAALTAAMDTALSVCEAYCDRYFERQDVVEVFNGYAAPGLMLKRYPLNDVVGVILGETGETVDPARYAIDPAAGILRGAFAGRQIEVSYNGGYDPLPADLEFALWATFDVIYYSTPGAGATAGASAQESGPIKAFVINGVRMEYAAPSSGSGGDVEAYGVIPVSAVAILSRYRWHSVIGAG